MGVSRIFWLFLTCQVSFHDDNVKYLSGLVCCCCSCIHFITFQGSKLPQQPSAIIESIEFFNQQKKPLSYSCTQPPSFMSGVFKLTLSAAFCSVKNLKYYIIKSNKSKEKKGSLISLSVAWQFAQREDLISDDHLASLFFIYISPFSVRFFGSSRSVEMGSRCAPGGFDSVAPKIKDLSVI